ncbi:MAG: glycosyltransferase family protein [Desulfovibrionales bacterium]
MRILNVEAAHFVPSWRALGHQVLTLGTNPDADVTIPSVIQHDRLTDILESLGFAPDLLFWCDANHPPLVTGMEKLPFLCAGYSIYSKTHLWHAGFAAGFDLFFAAQKKFVRENAARKWPHCLQWLPVFCDPEREYDYQQPRLFDVSFFGSVDPSGNPQRKDFLKGFRNAHPLTIRHENAVGVCNKSRVLLLQSRSGEFNFLPVRAAACGAVPLLDHSFEELEGLFTPGEDCLVYERGDFLDAASVVRECLAEPMRLRQLAERGKHKARSCHTVHKRAQKILERVSASLRSGTSRRLTNIQEIKDQVSHSYLILATNEKISMDRNLRQFYFDQAQTT